MRVVGRRFAVVHIECLDLGALLLLQCEWLVGYSGLDGFLGMLRLLSMAPSISLILVEGSLASAPCRTFPLLASCAAGPVRTSPSLILELIVLRSVASGRMHWVCALGT